MNNDGQKIIEIGETEALRRALSVFKPVATTLIGPGDDAAVISVSDSRVVITTDTMVQDHDFRLEWSSGFDIGYKAVTSNVADLVAMGAAPRALTVALVVTKETPQAWLEDFASGLQSACDRHAPECQIVGGDLASGEQIVIAIAAHGDLESRQPILRSTAEVGDLIVIAGTLGKAACGLALLSSNDETLSASYPELVSIQLRPVPDFALGLELAAVASSMLDVSDGLSLDAGRLASSSNVSMNIKKELLEGYAAILEQAAQSINSRDSEAPPVSEWDWILHGGEDHCFLATVSPTAALPRGTKVIGEVIAKGDSDVYLSGQPLSPKGWDSVTG
ncbi:thiamine-phosphate kinase [Aquiluna sp. Uisw_065]|uniref:thiamine-phosphate kinase n=1 Tax=Aquiluna sp. Uisw_065 TaxID=3230967 RepID=UPI0035911539